MSKGQLNITAEQARAMAEEADFAKHLPSIEERIRNRAIAGCTDVDLGLWTEASEYLQRKLECNGFSVTSSTERSYTSSGEAKRLKVSWGKNK